MDMTILASVAVVGIIINSVINVILEKQGSKNRSHNPASRWYSLFTGFHFVHTGFVSPLTIANANKPAPMNIIITISA